MHLLSFIAFLAVFCISKALAEQMTGNTTWYAVFFLPHATITIFQSTLIVPASSCDEHIPGNMQGVWPGLQPDNNEVVLQNVLVNQGEDVGEWFLVPWYCCSPVQTWNSTRIYPGDQLLTEFYRYPATKSWLDIWWIIPGDIGTRAGETISESYLDFNPDDFPIEGTFEQAILSIEIQNFASWDFGTVEWRNIIIEAETTDTEWCDYPIAGPGFKMTNSKPMVWIKDGKTTCEIESLTQNKM